MPVREASASLPLSVRLRPALVSFSVLAPFLAPLGIAGSSAVAERNTSTAPRDVAVIVDPVRDGPDESRYARRAARGAPLQDQDVFDLHSRSGSSRTIYLDFVGTEVRNTIWNDPPANFNQPAPLPAGFYGGWTLDSDPTTFSSLERDFIREVFAIVAEDFAPFDVNVTTKNPGMAALTRSDLSDVSYGTRALVTSSDVALDAICGGACSGVAILDAFDEHRGHTQLQPAWVFSQVQSSQNPRPVAETISHEVGHNLGLSHDGKGSEEYYEGQDIWTPIMGFSDFRPISHWSDGGYTGATNVEDDVSLIAANGAPLVPDEAGDTVGTAAASVPPNGGIIDVRSDVDVFSLGACNGTVTVRALPAAVSPNLDIDLAVLDATGTVRGSDNPLSTFGDGTTAGGMGATVTLPANGPLYARVDGVGNGNPSTGYDDYGSLGRYTLEVSGCSTVTPTASPTPTATASPTVAPTVTASPTATATPSPTTTASPTATSSPTATPDPVATVPDAPIMSVAKPGRLGGALTARITWFAPFDDGGSEVTGYRMLGHKIKDGRIVRSLTSKELPADRLRAEFEMPRGRWAFQVIALNAEGESEPSGFSRTIKPR